MSMHNAVVNETGLDTWVRLASKGAANAITSLSRLVGHEVDVISLSARPVLVKDAASLLGGPETRTVGIYLGVTGSAAAHVLIVYQPKTAQGLVEILLGSAPGSTDLQGEMEQSVLGEVGNIMGSSFLATLADASGLDLRVSPPAVMMDMAGAILDVAMSSILEESAHALVVETNFSTEDRQISGTLLVMPSPDLLRTLLEHITNGGKHGG